MGEPVGVDVVASTVPGSWRIAATNFPMWLNGSRRDPEFEYRLRSTAPLALDDRVHYTDDRDRRRTISGVDRWTGDSFVWRGSGLLGLLRSRWSVAFLADDLMVLHFEKSRVTPSGTDVAVRTGAEHPELRRQIASDPTGFGLTLEQFASLTWLEQVPSART